MERRKWQQSGDAAAAAARSHFSAQTKAESARQQAAFDAAQRSRQILEEEKAKDKAWREAVLKVLLCIVVLFAQCVLLATSMHVSLPTLDAKTSLKPMTAYCNSSVCGSLLAYQCVAHEPCPMQRLQHELPSSIANMKGSPQIFLPHAATDCCHADPTISG